MERYSLQKPLKMTPRSTSSIEHLVLSPDRDKEGRGAQLGCFGQRGSSLASLHPFPCCRLVKTGCFRTLAPIGIVADLTDFYPTMGERRSHWYTLSRRLQSTLKRRWHPAVDLRRKHSLTSFRSSRFASASVFKSRSSRMAAAVAARVSCPSPLSKLGPNSPFFSSSARMLSFLHQTRYRERSAVTHDRRGQRDNLLPLGK